MEQIAFLLIMFAALYLLMIRPQQRRQREHEDMLKALQKGDKVRTRGGLLGEVVEIALA